MMYQQEAQDRAQEVEVERDQKEANTKRVRKDVKKQERSEGKGKDWCWSRVLCSGQEKQISCCCRPRLFVVCQSSLFKRLTRIKVVHGSWPSMKDADKCLHSRHSSHTKQRRMATGQAVGGSLLCLKTSANVRVGGSARNTYKRK
eukprot:m.224332 g.224332  ORF g.224332 m.224332 type:complete len:145 (+) comp17033_c1_seq1:2041-2475(+)